MLEKYDLESLVKKIGGHFQLTVLIQRRLKESKNHALKLGQQKQENIIDKIIQELLEDKIKLLPEEERSNTVTVQEMFNRPKTETKPDETWLVNHNK